jgi:hypothetical protein
MSRPDFQQQELEYNLRKYLPARMRIKAIRALRRLLKARAEDGTVAISADENYEVIRWGRRAARTPEGKTKARQPCGSGQNRLPG